MKKKIMTAVTVVFAFCLVFTVYASAFNRTDVSPKGNPSCCAKKDSCAMKNKQTTDKTSCCDRDDCTCKGDGCCKGDSCAMKSNGEKSEGKNCCGDSCPMKKDAEKQTVTTVDMTNVTVAGSGEGCKGGACCKNKKN